MVSFPKSVVTPRRLTLAGATLLAGGLVAAGAVVYLQREAIAVHLAFDYLNAHGVPAAIRLDRLDLGGVAGQVRLGPRARPDLTVGRLEARFGALPSPWRGVRAPPVRSLTLIQPVLHGRWRDGRLDFGDLQPLIDQAMAAKPNGQPAPDLTIRDGRVVLDTPSGPLLFAVDAAVQGGLVRTLHVRLQPADLHAFGLHVSGVQGVLSGAATARGGLHLSGAFAAARGRSDRGAAVGLTLAVEALLPNGAAAGRPQGPQPVEALIRLKAPRFELTPDRGAPVDVRAADATLDLTGQVDPGGEVLGRLRVFGHAGRLTRGGLELASTGLELRSDDARLDTRAASGVVQGPFSLAVSSAGGRFLAGDLQAGLQPFSLRSGGRIALQGRRVAVQATGGLEGGVALPAGEAAGLARQALGNVDAAAEHALARALQQVRLAVPTYALTYGTLAHGGSGGLRLALPQGVRADVPGGALILTPTQPAPMLVRNGRGDSSGGFGLTLTVAGLPQTALRDARYAVSPAGDLRLAAALSAEGDLGAVRGGALQVAGELTRRGDRWTLSSADCAHVTALALRSGAQALASGVRGEACPAPGAPLASVEGGRWRVRTELRGVKAALPGAEIALQLAGADVALDGDRRGPAGRLAIEGLAVQDTSAPARMRPMTGQGVLTLAGGEVRGRVSVALTQGRGPGGGAALGLLTLDARPAAGVGSADFDSGRLGFASGALQPGDIAPGLARLLPQAKGELQALARFDWSRTGLVSSGELRSEGLSFKSPAGRLDGVRGDVRLASLSPLVSAPGQTVTADRLETVVPLDRLQIGFTLGARALELQAASARAAGGRISLDAMRLPLAAPLATTGVLRLQGVDLQRLIDALNLANAVNLQARVDGALPFSLQPGARGATALRLAQGRVYATGPGRLTIRRQALSGAVTTAGAGAQPGAVEDFAYQALEDLAFTRLDAGVASRAGGRLGVVFHVVGRHDPKVDRPTRIGVFALLRGHAFDKPLPLPKGTPVDLTLDTSLNLDDILAAYGAFGASTGSAKVQP